MYVDDGSVDVPLGDYLGDLTNELRPGHHIVEFLSGGPKNYGYREDDGRETVKVKGICLHHTNRGIINFDSIRDLLLDDGEPMAVTEPRHIVRDKYKQTIRSVPQTKKYRIVYTKRRILPDLNTLPYGY